MTQFEKQKLSNAILLLVQSLQFAMSSQHYVDSGSVNLAKTDAQRSDELFDCAKNMLLEFTNER
jgi:hypothetical protein